jgi:colanic acid biosynthesis glycosyl transferase WcaI
MRVPALNRPIRVLVIPDKYLPDQCGGGAIYTDMCRGLAQRGLDVTVRCPYPFYPEWTDKSGRNGWRVERYDDEGVKVERYGMFIPRNSRSVVQRMLLDLSFFASLCRSLLDGERFDAAIAFCPHTGGLAFAALHKFLFGGPLCLSIMDLPADAVTASGMTREGWLPRLFQRVQSALFNRAEVWRSISPVMVKRLESLRHHDQPVLFIPDWLHPSIADEIQRLPSKIGRPPAQPVRLLYSGNIGAKQGLLDFCKILHATGAPLQFQIHGEGGGAVDVRDWVASCGDGRFLFGPLNNESEFAHSMHEADLFVVTEKPENRAAFFPSKTIPAMASGTPILAVSSPDSPLGREVRAEGLGPWFSWDEGEAIAALLSSLPDRTEEFITWQSNAARRSRYFDRERCLDLIETVLVELVEDRSHVRSRSTRTPERWATLISRTAVNSPAPQSLSSLSS